MKKSFFTTETVKKDRWGDDVTVSRLNIKRVIAVVAVIFLAIIVFCSSLTIIPTGYTGVKTTFQQIDNTPVSAGPVWKIPFVQSIKQVCTKQQDMTFEGQVWSETSERTAIYYDGITVTFQINGEKAAWILANVSDYKASLITSGIVSSAIKTASKELNSTDATNRGKIEPLAQEKLQKALNEKYGPDVVYINKVVIANVDFEDTYNKAIADKQNAQLAYEQQAIENKKAVEKAEADAEVAKKKAEGEADAIKIKAEAEAEANKKIAESLNDSVLTNKYYEKWNGELPQAVGSDSGIIIDGRIKTE